MADLIAGLTILAKYAKPAYSPTHCEHDVLMVTAVPNETPVSVEDEAELDRLGFFKSEEFECWSSFRFGSS